MATIPQPRTIVQIKQAILNQILAEPNLAALTNPSKTAIWNLMAYVMAVCMFLHENLWLNFLNYIEGIISVAAPGTPQWIQAMMYKFQYGDIVQLINLIPTYTTINTANQIVSQCAIISDANKNVTILLATGSPPVALSSPQLADAQGYIDAFDFAGISCTAVSLDADRLFCQAIIYYNGQYAATIQATVIAAIQAFLSLIPFNGVVKVSQLEEEILNVPGVTDVNLQNVRARPNLTVIGSAVYLVQASQLISRLWQTNAGYIIAEDTATYTLADSLTFTQG